MKLLGTGLSGMVGSYVVDRLKDRYEFENLSLETGVDITKPEVVDRYVSQSKSPWMLHFAAFTNVDAAEAEKAQAVQSTAWKVNVTATEGIVEACKKYHKKLLYISTDFVFPGGDQEFTETDTPKPIGWYAQTKYEGENRVAGLGDQGLIVRIAFPYGASGGAKADFVAKMRERFDDKQSVVVPVDQIFVPTFLGDIAAGLRVLLEHNAFGIYHLVGTNSLSSFEAAMDIVSTFGYDASLVQKTTAAEFYAGRAPRAFQLRIKNDKILKLGLVPLSFRQGLAKMKEGIQ